jgi:DNA modification methylase
MRGLIKWKSYNDYLAAMLRVMKENFRVTEEGRYIIYNICDYLIDGKRYSIPSDFIFIGKKVGMDYIDDIIWVKPYGVGRGMRGSGQRAGSFIQYPYPLRFLPNNRYEHWIIWRKGKLRHPYPKKDKINYESVKSFLSDIWEVTPVTRNQFNIDKIHPAEFPIIFPINFIKFWTFKGDKVLDPFLGSGTTLRAALELKRKGVGYEINKEYEKYIRNKLLFNIKNINEFIK